MSESAGKAIDLLFYLARTEGDVTLARLSRETGMNKATALRYLSVLESRGVAERHDGAWSLGLALYELGTRVPVRSLVVERVRPHLECLARETGETANLVCLSGDNAVNLDRAEADRSLRMRAMPGDRMPLYCTGAGKAILSALPDDRVHAILGSEPLPRINEHTLTLVPDILADIEKTKRQGYGIDHEEYEIGLTCIAMPVSLPENDFYGAMSVSGPTARMRDEGVREKMINALRRSADAAVESLKNKHGVNPDPLSAVSQRFGQEIE